MKAPNIVIACLALAIAGFLIKGFFGGPEGKIRKQLEKLEETVSYTPGDGNMGTLTKIKGLGKLFTEDVHIEMKMPHGTTSVEGRHQLQQLAMASRSRAQSLEASLHDLVIEVSENQQTATVEATGRAKLSEAGNQTAVQDFIFHFEKTDEGWLISKVRTIEALR